MLTTMFRTIHAIRFPRVAPLRFARLAFDAHRQRRSLARLDAARLRDIGVDPTEAEAEISRPAWDVPRHWLK